MLCCCFDFSSEILRLCNSCFLRGLLLLSSAGPRELVGDPRSEGRTNHQRITSDTKSDEYKIETNRMGQGVSINPPPRPPSLPAEKVFISPLASGRSTLRARPVERVDPTNSVACYDIASLQLFTNSFSQENFIGEGTIGSVYKGELSGGKVRCFRFLNFLCMKVS